MIMEKKMASLFQDLKAKPLLIFFLPPLIFLFILLRFQRKSYPPGPRGWPVIGNIGLADQLTHRALTDLARKHGGIFRLRMGFLHMVVVSSPDVARQVLQVHDNIFSNRPANIAVRYLTYDRADMSFAHYGPFWRQARKLTFTKLLSHKRAVSWHSIQDKVDDMIRVVAAMSTGTSVNIGKLVSGLMRDIIYRAAFGSNPHEGPDDIVVILQKFSELFGAFSLADFIPFLGWMDRGGLKSRLANTRASLDRYIDSIIDDHVEKKQPEVGPDDEPADTDLVDELLALYNDETKVSKSEDLQNSVKLTRNNVRGIIMDIMFGGIEATASSIEWAMSELMRSPEDLKRVQQELNDVVGLARKVEEPDLEKLIYLRCCLKEVLRLHPPVPLLLHETIEDVVVSGYHVPAKSCVMINVWAIGRDHSVWKDAESFKPARFLKDGAPNFKGSNFEFIPFGSGRRSCPAMQFGFHALELAAAHLLHCFTWELQDGTNPGELDMSDAFGLTAPHATTLKAVPSPRLQCCLN